MSLQEIEEADMNWKDIEEIMESPNCWAVVKRYDRDWCRLIRKDTEKVVYEGTTGVILTILEDTCEVEKSEKRKERERKRLLKELEKEVEDYE